LALVVVLAPTLFWSAVENGCGELHVPDVPALLVQLGLGGNGVSLWFTPFEPLGVCADVVWACAGAAVAIPGATRPVAKVRENAAAATIAAQHERRGCALMGLLWWTLYSFDADPPGGS
jgi:hypothetical protein